MMHPKQFRDEVLRPALKEVGLWSPEAELLLMITCAKESLMGFYLKQLNDGPAVGVFQMEPNTYYDIVNHYLEYRPELTDKVLDACSLHYLPGANYLISNLKLATIMARLQYYRVSSALPEVDDIDGMARYWKEHYNTIDGKGSPEEFLESYNKYIKGAL